MIRRFFVWLHRWAGLVMALPLIFVGLTGSVLAFRGEIDAWLNPELFTVAQRHAPLLSGIALREKAAALYPHLPIDDVPLDIRPGRAAEFVMVTNPNHFMETAFEVFLDPYTGQKVGERPLWSGPSLTRRNVMSYLFRAHFDLALPWNTGELGATILGVTAIVWTLDCFIGLYLTFPRFRRVSGSVASGAKGWLTRWKLAWLIKFGASAFRVNFDIHRAFGLWTWLMLLVLAWSSVGFNVDQVYTPVMHAMLSYAQPAPGLPQRAKPLEHPRLDWQAAYATGHSLLANQAREHGFIIEKERDLRFNSDLGVYTIAAESLGKTGETDDASVSFDADTGALLQSFWPGSQPQKIGDVVTLWLFWLHTAAELGYAPHWLHLPLQIAIFLMGLVITALAITGIYIWWRKRQVRILADRKQQASSTQAVVQPEGGTR